jgi:hypothetical protein
VVPHGAHVILITVSKLCTLKSNPNGLSANPEYGYINLNYVKVFHRELPNPEDS